MIRRFSAPPRQEGTDFPAAEAALRQQAAADTTVVSPAA